MDDFIDKEKELENNSIMNLKPMEGVENRSDMFKFLCEGYQSCRSILNSLEGGYTTSLIL